MTMEGNQEAGDEIAGMSKTQLYEIMSQMKALIEQNKQKARQILIQNPTLTRALFQAQIMLGMVQPPHGLPKAQSALDQQPNVEPTPTAQKQRRTEQPSKSMLLAPQPVASHSLPPRDHFGPQSTPVSLPQPSQGPIMTHQLPQHVASSRPTQSQQPLHSISNQYMPQPPLQTSIPPKPRVSVPSFPQQGHSQMGQNLGYQRPSGPQMHPSQAIFHPGANPPAGLGPPFQQGQGGNPQLGMEFSQSRPPSSFAGQAGPSNQPPRPPPLTNDMEKALLQQVMSLTPEQISMLPIEQRNQIFQLQQMLRQ